jgi:hypothetical protein
MSEPLPAASMQRPSLPGENVHESPAFAHDAGGSTLFALSERQPTTSADASSARIVVTGRAQRKRIQDGMALRYRTLGPSGREPSEVTQLARGGSDAIAAAIGTGAGMGDAPEVTMRLILCMKITVATIAAETT